MIPLKIDYPNISTDSLKIPLNIITRILQLTSIIICIKIEPEKYIH